jgi:hypothetical protein
MIDDVQITAFYCTAERGADGAARHPYPAGFSDSRSFASIRGSSLSAFLLLV